MEGSSGPPDQPKKSGLLHSVRLPRKPSLPSLFMSSSSFLQSYLPPDLPSSSRVVSDPVMSSKDTRDVNDVPIFTLPAPSSLLLDDDPFALLTPPSPSSPRTRSLLDMGCPPISESVKPSTVELSPRVHVPQASSARPKSSHGHVRPAHTRPAFTPRPSLPSLRTLVQMNVVVPRKVRKGTVGAHLPHEPWDLDLSAESCPPSRSRSLIAPSEDKPAGLPLENEAKGSGRDSSNVFSEPSALNGGSTVTSVDNVTSGTRAPNEVVPSRSLSMHDADVESLPSLSYTTSGPPSSALSRASSLQSSTWSDPALNENVHSNNNNNDGLDQKDSVGPDSIEPTDGEDDLLSYHSDFDYYYTQSLSDSSDSEQDSPERTPSVDGTPSPRGSVYQESHFEPGTSADTMRSGLGERAPRTYHPSIPHDKHEWHGQRGTLDKRTSAGDRRGLEQEMYGQVSRRSSSRAGRDQGGRGVDTSGTRHYTRGPSLGSTSDFSLSSANEDNNTVYHSIDGVSNGPSRTHSPLQSRIPRTGGGSDDDVPLAQRMPTALKAQKSIRQQLHDERHQRKLDRTRSTNAPPPVPTLKPMEANVVPGPRSVASGRKRSASSAAPPRTGLLWPEASTSHPSPIPPEDLSRKLMQLQTSSSGSAEQDLPTSFSRKAKLARSTTTSPTRGRHTECTAHTPQLTVRGTEASSQNRSLKTAPPFHRPDRRHAESPNQPSETMSAQSLGRSMTVGARHIPDDIHGRVSVEGKAHSVRNGGDTRAGHEPVVRSGRISEDKRRPPGSLSRPSVDRESNTSNQRVAQRLPLPAPPPASTSTSPLQPPKVSVIQQRIFIGDMQRFNTVEITSNTTAGDVVKLMASQGILDKSGSWMLFELAQDYGMERPVRAYELLLDVSASWDKDKLLNAFVIKPTPMARLLSPSAIPSCSPTHRGWVEWESKRGKWSKRWMELREHGLWLSKRDTGKDETFLCSMSNFDAYYVTRRHKSPKPFVFAIKSTDHLSLFENAADYLHVFSCNQRDGEKWMEAILVARSYVLHQEKHVLCTRPVETLSQAQPLSRTRTRKQSVSSRPAQPLISVPPPFSVSPTANVVFEPGSLLAKRKGDLQT